MSLKNNKSFRPRNTKRLAVVFGPMTFLVLAWVGVSLSANGQEIEGSGSETSDSAVFSNTGCVELITPSTSRVGVNAYRFYLGNLGVSIALVEVPFAVQKHLVFTPSYLFVSMPPSGLSLLMSRPAYRTYRENQFRIAATILTTWHGFLFSDRSMYVRRFTPFGDFNRYRNKVYVSRTVTIERYKITPFAFYEVYHDFQPGPWPRRSWYVAAVDMPITKHLTFQPSYIRQDDQYLRSINFLATALLIRTNQLFHPGAKHSSRSANKDEEGEPVNSERLDVER